MTSAPPATSDLLLTVRGLDRVRSARGVLGMWLVSRAVVLLLFAINPLHREMWGDPFYYHLRLTKMLTAGIGVTMIEYPVPAIGLLAIPWLLGLGNAIGYVIGFVVFMLVLDAGFSYLLWRMAGRRRTAAFDLWLIMIVAIGPLAYLRFDLIPAVLIGAALLLASVRPGMAGAFVAIGAAVKLWPALIFPALLTLRRPGRIATTVGFVTFGVGLALLSWRIAGWDRLVSPLRWQSDRGLQVESIPATVLMAARSFAPTTWTTAYTRYNAFELVSGPGIDASLAVASVLSVAGLATIVGLLVRAFISQRVDEWQLALLALAIVSIMIVTNKTLSPQYLLWLGGPLAFLLLSSESDPSRFAISRRLALSGLVVMALTQLLYPLVYPILITNGQPFQPLATLVLVVRNVLLVIFTVRVVWLAAKLP